MVGKFDIHLHTKASDGLLEPEEVVRLAASSGLACIAITDHDTTDGVQRARAEGARLRLPVIAGGEFTAAFDGELHILGYGMDLSSEPYGRFLREQRMRREERNAAMIDKLRKLGAPLPEEFLPQRFSGSYGRMHMARGLIASGHAVSVQQAFDKYLSRHGLAYAPRRKFSSQELLNAIAASGGQAVLAHPGRMGLGWKQVARLAADLAAEGMVGMEVFYPTHTADEVRLYRRIADGLGLVATYGSDWHGYGDGLAARFSDFEIPDRTYCWLEKLAAEQGVGQ